jgi:hypothetical protein
MRKEKTLDKKAVSPPLKASAHAVKKLRPYEWRPCEAWVGGASSRSRSILLASRPTSTSTMRKEAVIAMSGIISSSWGSHRLDCSVPAILQPERTSQVVVVCDAFHCPQDTQGAQPGQRRRKHERVALTAEAVHWQRMLPGAERFSEGLSGVVRRQGYANGGVDRSRNPCRRLPQRGARSGPPARLAKTLRIRRDSLVQV